jgi:hypothetical protein
MNSYGQAVETEYSTIPPNNGTDCRYELQYVLEPGVYRI